MTLRTMFLWLIAFDLALAYALTYLVTAVT